MSGNVKKLFEGKYREIDFIMVAASQASGGRCVHVCVCVSVYFLLYLVGFIQRESGKHILLWM